MKTDISDIIYNIALVLCLITITVILGAFIWELYVWEISDPILNGNNEEIEIIIDEQTF